MPANHTFFIVIISTALLFADRGNAQTENKNTSSLRKAAENFSKAVNEKDTATFFSFLDSNLLATVREGDQASDDFNGFKTIVRYQFQKPEMNTVTTFQIEEVKVSVEPEWAGYD